MSRSKSTTECILVQENASIESSSGCGDVGYRCVGGFTFRVSLLCIIVCNRSLVFRFVGIAATRVRRRYDDTEVKNIILRDFGPDFLSLRPSASEWVVRTGVRLSASITAWYKRTLLVP